MADISQIKLPNGDTFDLVDEKSGYITVETDPVFSASAAAGITSTDISNWNSKEIFYAEYDVTTYAELVTAYNAGKNIICQADIHDLDSTFSTGMILELPLVNYNTSINNFIFGAFIEGLYIGVNASSNGWIGVVAPIQSDWASNDINGPGYIQNKPTIPSISLNGSSTTSASFYAPTTAGTSGQVLTSNGSGAPTWAAAPSGGGDDIFIAEYGVTTFDAIKAAYEADKYIILKISDGGTYAVLMPLIQLVDMRATSSPYAVVGFAITQNSNSIGSLASCTCTVSPDPEDSSQLIEEWDQYGLDVQPKLISGTNIKTINNQSILGSGNLTLNIPEVYNSSTNPNGYLTMSTLPIYDGTVV